MMVKLEKSEYLVISMPITARIIKDKLSKLLGISLDQLVCYQLFLKLVKIQKVIWFFLKRFI